MEHGSDVATSIGDFKMKNRCVLLLRVLAVACLLAAWPQMAAAYVGILPPTLGDLCRQATHISVLKVDKVSVERGVILFKSVEQLKGKGEPLPDTTFAKQVVGPNVNGAKVILDWAAEGKTAVVFAKDYGLKSAAHVYIDGYWYLVGWNIDSTFWAASNGEPTMLVRYCGTADKLGDAVTKVLRGEEVVVPAMTNDDRKALEEGRAKVQDVRASLKILGDPKRNIDDDQQPKPGAKRPDEKSAKPAPDTPQKKPEAGDKKPGGTKPVDKAPALVGTVKAIAADGKSFTLVLPPPAKNKEPVTIDIQLSDRSQITAGKEAAKLAAGQVATVWLEKGDGKVASAIQIGKPAGKPATKPAPGDKPGKPTPDATEKKPDSKKSEPD